MNFAQRLKMAMDCADDHKGVKQAELARRAGVTRAAINHWLKVEAKVFPMKGEVLLGVCSALGVSPWWLMYEKGEMNASFVNDSGALELLRYYFALPGAARDTAIEQVKQLFNLLSTTSNSVTASNRGTMERSRYQEKLKEAQTDLQAAAEGVEHADEGGSPTAGR